MTIAMLLLSNSLLIDLLPLVENLFALGQKPFRHRSKTFSTKGEKERSDSNAVNTCVFVD